MQKITRRAFLKTTVLSSAAVGILRPWGSVLGANDDIRVAVIGFNGRGSAHVNAFTKMSGVRLVALCDVDQAVLNRYADRLKKDGLNVQTYRDVRQL